MQQVPPGEPEGKLLREPVVHQLRCGATGSAPPLVGASFMKRFYSVGDLYSRVRWTMPAPEKTRSARRTTCCGAYRSRLTVSSRRPGTQSWNRVET